MHVLEIKTVRIHPETDGPIQVFQSPGFTGRKIEIFLCGCRKLSVHNRQWYTNPSEYKYTESDNNHFKICYYCNKYIVQLLYE